MRARTLIAAVFALVFVTVGFSYVHSYRTFAKALATVGEKTAQHDRADDAARRIRTTTIDMEAGLRGYLLTREPRFLEPYDRGSAMRVAVAKELVASMASDPSGQRLADRLGNEIEAWVQEVAIPLLAVDVFEQPEARRRALLDSDKSRMDQIRLDIDDVRRLVVAMRASEVVELRAYESAFQTQIVWTCVAVGVVLLGAGLWLLRRIEQPLARLVEATEAPLEEERPLELPSVREIVKLERALSGMRRGLADDRRRERRFTQLVSILSSAVSPAEVAAEAARHLSVTQGVAAAVVWLARTTTAPLELGGVVGVDAAALPSGGGPLAREARAKNETLGVQGIGGGEGEALVVRSSLVSVAVNAVTAAPISVGDRVLGILEIAGSGVDVADVERSLERVGVALEAAAEREQKDLLGQELAAINEELEAQNEELRQQEEELRAQGLELERRERELTRKNIELTEASGAKNIFLSSMSHELRTPLNAVIGFAEVLLADTYGPLSSPQKRAVGDIQTAGRQLLTLVNDVLDLAKVEAGRLDVELGAVDAGAIAHEVCCLLAPVAKRRRITVVERADGAAVCTADSDRLRQVLVNLLGNAVKFSPEGGEVSVNVRASGSTIRIEVADSGPGISAVDQARLFQPFVQLEGPSRALGTGLGLAIAKRLSTLMGATIEVTSEPGRGATFSVTLPKAGAGALLVGPSRPQRRASSGKLRAVRPRRGAHVLVVEDDPSDAKVIEGLLGRGGHQVRVEATAEGALGALAEQRFALVLLDLRLPGMSGEGLVDAIRADPALRGTRLVILTGASIDGEASRTLAGKVDLLAEKGVMTDGGFLDTLHSLLEESNGKVLIVDDNEANRRVARAMLDDGGYRVEEAASGEEALARTEAGGFDLVLMDVRMPGLDGLETAARLHARASTARVPVVAVSAQAMRGDRERALAAGCVDYVTKPVARAELLRAVERALAGVSGAPPAVTASERGTPGP